MTLGTRIAVMSAGAIEQVAPPLDVFERPATAFVARFVGSPTMNLWPGRVSRHGAPQVSTAAFALDLTPAAAAQLADGTEVTIGIRPHDIRLVALAGANAQGTVEIVEPLGAHVTTHVRLPQGGELVRVQVATADARPVGSATGLHFARERVHVFDRASGRRLA